MTKHKRAKQKKHTMGSQLRKLVNFPILPHFIESYVKPLYNLSINIPIFYKNHPEKDFYAHPPLFTSSGSSQDPREKTGLYEASANVSAKLSYRHEHKDKPHKVVHGGSRGLVLKY